MKATVFAIVLLTWLYGATGAETVEMTSGPDLAISYDPAAWKPLSPLRKPEPGAFQKMTWTLQDPEWAQITVESHPEPKTESQFKREALEIQKLRGEPAELVRERRESLAGQEWLVLEFRNPHTLPARSEILYFLPAAAGHSTLFIVCEERNAAKHRQAIGTFLRGLQLK